MGLSHKVSSALFGFILIPKGFDVCRKTKLYIYYTTPTESYKSPFLHYYKHLNPSGSLLFSFKMSYTSKV